MQQTNSNWIFNNRSVSFRFDWIDSIRFHLQMHKWNVATSNRYILHMEKFIQRSENGLLDRFTFVQWITVHFVHLRMHYVDSLEINALHFDTCHTIN